ncbi:Bifunctional inhibitor/lipid-transfer protein/seed storage 2S albumin superfamily protein [Raphanus sativus]|uniref:Non-specific lipid transfer protein GPI-anchored 33-like n=1 Tax=Raphanus sativus TaxID=3726 RepID=A0A6J0M9N0_RAPSA|nr:non-specific lipid transfer protein GPI-anchored 33-like [Raphanus sativus]KAJ4912905.1 Bifunctional inhibitor/lipid-transfer protein/seed storage 2S albumin superfamily protein [Raphanus sativus]
MAYTNKISAAAAVATAMLFLAVMIAPRWTEAQTMPKLDPVCALLITDTLTKCYLSGNLTPSDDCCSALKSATDRQVTCLCDDFIAHSSDNNVTQALLEVYHNDCGVADKFACKGNSNGGAMKKISASIGLLGLAASLFF